MAEFKDALKKILEENKIPVEAAKAISEAVDEGFTSLSNKIEEQKAIEEQEAVELLKTRLRKKDLATYSQVREGVKRLTSKCNTRILEESNKHTGHIKFLHSETKRILAEDYSSFKKELAEKVKLFTESKISKMEAVIREQLEKEIKAPVELKLSQIAEAVQPYIKKEQPKVIVADDSFKKEKATLSEEIKRLKDKVNSLVGEKVSLTKTVSEAKKQLNEEINKPLKVKMQKPKVNEVKQENKTETKQPNINEAIVNDILRLSGYTTPAQN